MVDSDSNNSSTINHTGGLSSLLESPDLTRKQKSLCSLRMAKVGSFTVPHKRVKLQFHHN